MASIRAFTNATASATAEIEVLKPSSVQLTHVMSGAGLSTGAFATLKQAVGSRSSPTVVALPAAGTNEKSVATATNYTSRWDNVQGRLQVALTVTDGTHNVYLEVMQHAPK